MTDMTSALTGAAADLERLATKNNVALQRKIIELLREDRFRLTAALYRLDVDEIQTRTLLAEATHDQEVDRVAAGLARLILHRLRTKVRTTADHRRRREGELSR